VKILLINPPALHEIKGPHPFKAEDMGTFPHLGLMYIAAVLGEEGGFEVKLVDMPLEKVDQHELLRIFGQFHPQAVGITSYTDCLYDLKILVAALRKATPEVFICVGGPHVEVYPEETLEAFPVDCIIRGDGEYSFRELCRRLRDGKSWQDVRGVGYRNGTSMHLNEPWLVENLDDLPFPQRSLSSLHKVTSPVVGDSAITSICSSRGCPFPCTFCNSPYKSYRLRSPRNVAAEIEQCFNDYGISTFFFFDDLFNLNKRRLMDMCNIFQSLPFPIKWSFRGRINAVDEQVLRACKAAGCTRIHFGVEAGTERILKSYRKGVSLRSVREAFALCRQVGIETVGNFMLGAPTETREEMNETIRFAYALNPTFLEFHVLVPYPYTEIYGNMLSTGSVKEDVWRKFSLNPQPGFAPPLCEDHVSSEEMYLLLNQAYRGFYFRPRYVIQHLLKLKGLKDLWLKAKGAYRLLVVTDRKTGSRGD